MAQPAEAGSIRCRACCSAIIGMTKLLHTGRFAQQHHFLIATEQPELALFQFKTGGRFCCFDETGLIHTHAEHFGHAFDVDTDAVAGGAVTAEIGIAAGIAAELIAGGKHHGGHFAGKAVPAAVESAVGNHGK